MKKTDDCWNHNEQKDLQVEHHQKMSMEDFTATIQKNFQIFRFNELENRMKPENVFAKLRKRFIKFDLNVTMKFLPIQTKVYNRQTTFNRA
jgi:hypothetical protein